MPKITVGILTRNRVNSLLKAIQSAYDQNYRDMEILVVDSNSDDMTVDVVRKEFPNVHIIRLPSNLGCPGGRNHLYSNAEGEYIVNLDDDGWLGPDSLKRIQETFDSDPTIGIVCMRQCYPEEEPSRTCQAVGCNAIEAGLFKGGVSAFRMKMLKDTGLYPEDFFFFKEEEYLAMRAMDAGYRIVFRPDIIMWHPHYGPSDSADVSWDYYRFRNPLFVVVRLFPGWFMVRYLILRIGSYALISFRRRTFHLFLAAVANMLWRLPYLIQMRQPCSVEVVRKYFKLRNVVGD